MDEALRRVEREGSALERLRARRRAGWSEAEVWAGLVTPTLPFEDVLELAGEVSGFQRSEVDERCYRHDEMGRDFRLIPGGRLVLGGDGSRARCEVGVSPFFLCETPCTVGSWEEFAKRAGLEALPQGHPDEPKVEVSWLEARSWCEAVGLRLPSEAEWELACRAGGLGSFGAWVGGEGEELLGEGWFLENMDDVLMPVADLKPNAWGLYDMHGNVWEWCEDEAGADDEGGALSRLPAQAPTGALRRVCRGGDWLRSLSRYASEYRLLIDPGHRFETLGFRPARSFG